jgi:hypothetical protein
MNHSGNLAVLLAQLALVYVSILVTIAGFAIMVGRPEKVKSVFMVGLVTWPWELIRHLAGVLISFCCWVFGYETPHRKKKRS